MSGAFASVLAGGILLGCFTTGGSIGAEMAQASRRETLAVDQAPPPDAAAEAPASQDVAMLDTEHVCQGCDGRLYRHNDYADRGYRDGELVDGYDDAAYAPDVPAEDARPVAYVSAGDDGEAVAAPPMVQ